MAGLIAASLAACGDGSSGAESPLPPVVSSAAPGPNPAPASGSGRDCVNPQLHAPGTVIRYERRVTGETENGHSLVDYAVRRETEFNGHTGVVEIEIRTTNSYAGQNPASGVQFLYERVADTTTFRHGIVIPTVPGRGLPDMVLTTTFDPAVEFKALSLAVGDSYVREEHGTTTTAGGPVRNMPPVKWSERSTETYLGQETITVPAGTFTTCKIRRAVDTDNEVTNWVAKGSGIPVRDLQRAAGKERLIELLPGATINGEPIRIE